MNIPEAATLAKKELASTCVFLPCSILLALFPEACTILHARFVIPLFYFKHCPIPPTHPPPHICFNNLILIVLLPVHHNSGII